MIPATTQLYQSYPIICRMLQKRGYDVSDYPPLTLDHIEQQHLAHLRQPVSPQKPLSPIPPIIVQATDASYRASQEVHSGSGIQTELPFAKGSREWTEIVAACLATPSTEQSTELSTAFHQQYPVLAALTDEVAQAETRSNVLRQPTDVRQWMDEVSALYREMARPTAEVYFHQCFQHENLWGANSRDRKFMTEMEGMMVSMETTARVLFDKRCKPLQRMLTVSKWKEIRDSMADELVAVFKRGRTIICGYRTRNKASETLDKKYEVHCMELMNTHGIFVQLFNLKSLMYDVTAHEIVPIHHPLDRWHHGEEIARIQRVNNIRGEIVENGTPVTPPITSQLSVS